MKGGAWKLFVLALVVVIVAVATLTALVMPVVAGAVARAGDGSTAVVNQGGTACGAQIAVWPLDAVCQSGHACGG